MNPVVLLDPAFRTVHEIFTPTSLERLHDIATVVWGRSEPMPTDDFVEAARSADAIVFGGWRAGRAALDAATEVAALLEVAGGHAHDDLDYDACLLRGIRVGSCAPAFAGAVAEMALALALDAARGVTSADRSMRVGSERWLHAGNVGNTTLRGSTVGFVGYGGIARSLQRLLAPFDVTILASDPPIPDEVLRANGVRPTRLPDMFADADVLFVLAAPTADNRGLVSAELMDRLTPTQTLVVVSRALLVDFDAMTERVAAGRFKAGIDVYPEEPLPADHPIRRAEMAVCVPHIAGALPSALHLIGDMVVDDLATIFDGGEPTRLQYLTGANLAGLRQVAGPHATPDAP